MKTSIFPNVSKTSRLSLAQRYRKLKRTKAKQIEVFRKLNARELNNKDAREIFKDKAKNRTYFRFDNDNNLNHALDSLLYTKVNYALCSSEKTISVVKDK